APDPDGTRADIGAFHFPQLGFDFINHNDNNPKETSFRLTGAYPNPFNSTTTILYTLPARSNVLVRVLDLTGRQLEMLINEETNAGSHQVEWSPENLGAGVYLIQMQAGEFNTISKVMLIK
ncbi:MAG: T9SS type A sorting domain-containing protein, partial [Calditrichaeota bacterium]|nr:T9SS type A sorting domain-containing protein [Calditrichota bacterium]